jgi:hypothetical protein
MNHLFLNEYKLADCLPGAILFPPDKLQNQGDDSVSIDFNRG